MESGKWHCVSILEVTSVDVLVKGYISPRCFVCVGGGGTSTFVLINLQRRTTFSYPERNPFQMDFNS